VHVLERDRDPLRGERAVTLAKRARVGLVAVAVLLAASGCVSVGNLGLVARRGADPGKLLSQAHTYETLGNVEASACRYFVLAIIPFGDSAFSTAVEDALQRSGGDVLLNVSTSSSLYGFIPLLNVFSFTCTTVSGTAVKIKSAAVRRPTAP
jgi:hypothetical protein